MNIDQTQNDLLAAIANGLKNDEFKMYLQFIVDNKTKEIISAEALSRWESADNELIMPGKYIGAMEKSGMIMQLDYQIFEKVCRKLGEWVGTEFSNVSISCNFTRLTISEADFVKRINEIAGRYSFDRSKLIMEITEDSVERNLDVAKDNLWAVKELGFTISLDDIGSGYMSLRNICDYPIDQVKIDRAMLLLTDTERGKKRFHGIVSLMHFLDLKIVCEGVETEEQNTFVSSSNCDYIQGWYYSVALSEWKAEVFANEYMSRL